MELFRFEVQRSLFKLLTSLCQNDLDVLIQLKQLIILEIKFQSSNHYSQFNVIFESFQNAFVKVVERVVSFFAESFYLFFETAKRFNEWKKKLKL